MWEAEWTSGDCLSSGSRGTGEDSTPHDDHEGAVPIAQGPNVTR